MNLFARLILLLSPAILVMTLLRQLRRRRIRARYALAWTAAIMAIIPFAASPALTDNIARFVGISYAPALFLVAGFLFLGVMSIHDGAVITRLEERTRILAEEVAYLRLELGNSPKAQDTGTPDAV